MKPDQFAEKLNVFLEERRKLPYAWGTNDCVTFAADAIQSFTGSDPLGDLRGQWTNEEEANQKLEEVGGLVAAADARFPRRERNFAQRGDLVLIKDMNGNPSFGICVGAWAIAPGPEEALMTPMKKSILIWET